MPKYSTMGDHLDMMAEEMAEIIKEASDVIKVIMKIKRFGPHNEHAPEYAATHPGMDEPIDRLHQEIADFFAIYHITAESGTISRDKVMECIERKNKRLNELFGQTQEQV